MGAGGGPVRSRRTESESRRATPESRRTAPESRRTAPKGGRSRRPPSRTTVAVTGAASPVGAAIAARLATDESLDVSAADMERGDLDLTWRIGDIREPTHAKRVCQVDVVVHAEVVARGARSHPGPVVRGAQAILTAAAATGARRVVLLSSAMVYGAAPDNPVPLSEDHPLLAVSDDALVEELLELERLAERSRSVHPGLGVTVVRPAALVGPGAESVLHRYFDASRLLVAKDTHPRWQLCHVDDLARAIETVVVRDVDGAVTAGCIGALDATDVERITGARRLELPQGIAFATAERLHRLGVTSAPSSELFYVLHPWAVPSTRLIEAGWSPVWENDTALRALLAEERERPRRRREATIGAAGATVAVIGTAALVRAARKRRGV